MMLQRKFNMFVPISKVCLILGVSLSTVYRMLKAGKLKEAFRTDGNHRRFDEHHIHQLQRKTSQPRVVTYARVSSHDQKNDLIRQSQTLQRYVREHNYHQVIAIEDLGSGLNYKKKGLVLLLKMIFNREFEILVVNHRDRLLRFGFDLVEKMCTNHGIRMVVIDEQKKSFEEQLTQDVIELMTVFCAKLYGKRSHKNKLKL